MSKESTAGFTMLVVAILVHFATVSGSRFEISQGGTMKNDYAIDTYRPATQSNGFLDISPIQFNAAEHTFEIQIYPRSNTQCVYSMGAIGTANFFAIQIDDGTLVIRIGVPANPNFVLVNSSSNAVLANQWQTISVIVQSISSSNSMISAFVNGIRVIDNTLTSPFPQVIRTKVLIGRCQYSPSIAYPQGPQDINAVVDNFRIWNTTRSVQEIQATISAVDNDMNLTSVINHGNLLVFFPFTEGRGSNPFSAISSFITAALVADSVWIVKNMGNIYRTCMSSGTNVSFTVPSQAEVSIASQPLVGQWEQTSCGPNFIVRIFREPIHAWNLGEGCDVMICGPTTITAFTIKAFDDIFFLTTNGYLYVHSLDNTTFVPVSTGSGVRPSGVRYNYQTGKLFVEIPLTGYINADLYPLDRGGIEANLYFYQTQYCESFISGLCNGVDKTVSWNQFLFLNESWCGDRYVSGAEQCDGSPPCLINCMCAAGTTAQGGLCADVCGNGIVTGAEECDGTYGCTSQCKCMAGTVSTNGRCVDVCGNGIVTGQEQCDGGANCDKCKCISGYRPTSPLSTSCELIPVEFVPRVNPSLDCLDVLDNNIARLYFSYNNLDGFDQSIPYGKYNSFSPENFATSRPTVFSSGKSLTYPLSPYVTNITTSPSTLISSFSWLLGSFNLTVELTNLNRLQCPKDPSLEIELSTPLNLTNNDIQTIIDNLADSYSIDPSRINVTVIVNSTTQPPTYVLIITITSPTNATQKDATQVISDLFGDLKQNEEETKQQLTEGLEDVTIKQISTRPTGVEVRGQPTSSNGTPIASFTPQSDIKDAVSDGTTVTGAVILLLVGTVFTAIN